jgi:P-type Cu+ transporter
MEEGIKKKSSTSVRKLLDLRPAMALVIRDGEEQEEVGASNVLVDDILVVKPGEKKIPTDGLVL